MKKSLLSIILGLILFATMFTGCKTENNSPAPISAEPEEKDNYTIAVLVWSMAEEFGVDTVIGAEAKAKELGNVTIISPDPAGDMQKEISIFEDLIQQKVDAICVAPVDADAIIPYIDKAREAGIAIINYDIETKASVEAKVLCNNYEGGAMAADYLISEMGTEGKVLVLTEVPGVTTAEERIEGFEKRLSELAPNIEIIEQLSSGTRDTHRATTENMLQAHPDITGIFCFMGDNTLGAYTACQANKRTDVLIVGYDASEEQVEIMKNDGEGCNIICSIAQYPQKIGELVIETAYKILKNENVDDIIWIETGLLEAKKINSLED